ncbi:50S ribosomal protein L1 [bacterium]|nr:50S ribosomal protein L1 [bacterium]
MTFVSKRMKKMNEGLDKEKLYTISEALKVLKEKSTVKFDETVDVAMNLGIDTKQSDQNIRGMVSLPNGTGKKCVVAVFAKGPKATEAKDAGADIVGDDDLIANILKGQINFDRCIATPDMMAVLGKVAKILGPKGLMPNPKLGTVTMNVKEAVEKAKAGQVEYRAEKAGVVHAGVGKMSFGEAKLEENVRAFIDVIVKAKPATSKGTYLKKVTLSSTQGVGLRIDLGDLK